MRHSPPRFVSSLPLLLLVLLAGCLPSSQREVDRSVSAADSASAALAETVAVDTLEVLWTARASEAAPMPVPTGLAWLGDTLVVVETQEGSVRRISADGRFLDATALPADGFPYLAGTRGDTVVVLARQAGELWWAVPGQGVVRRVPAPDGAALALAAPGRLAVRVGGGPDAREPVVIGLDETGAETSRAPINGPAWRAIGRLRLWGDSLVALSGYRPVVDVLALGAAAFDTLALVGFTSPQAVRSAQFMRGDADEPPLLTSSAAALGDRLLAINLRTDHVRLDVYGRGGRLERVLVSRAAEETDVPLDLAVRERGDAVEIAVLWARPPGILSGPTARVVLYRWRPTR
ncbi:hypothetical protein [Rubrivirga sp. IMCC45206]|uniref:hypothetical protein n=1 Tax=Rubrivirga sp. IMCC45206 TaxID=3391614 RepID=UPI00398FC128